MNPNKIRKLRHQAFVRQSGRCCYCTLPICEGDPAEFAARHCISLRKANYLRCTAEHLVAQKDGGCDTAQNIAAACSWCNHMRHVRRQDKAPSPEKYKNRVTQLIAKRRWHPAIELCQMDSNSLACAANVKLTQTTDIH